METIPGCKNNQQAVNTQVGSDSDHWMRKLAVHFRKYQHQFAGHSPVVLLDVDSLRYEKRLIQPFLRLLRWFQIQSPGSVGVLASPDDERPATLHKWLQRAGRSTRLSISRGSIVQKDPEPGKQQGIPEEAFSPGRPKPVAVIRPVIGTGDVQCRIDRQHHILRIDVGITRQEKEAGQYTMETVNSRFGLHHLIKESELPDAVIPCWHGINDPENLQHFFDSDYAWGEVDVRINPLTKRLITRHDSFFISRFRETETIQYFESVLEQFKQHEKKIKIDFKRGFWVVDKVIRLLEKHGFQDDKVWFHGSVRVLRVNGYRKLARIYPGALIQATLDRFVPLILLFPAAGKFILDRLAGFGVNQFLLSWRSWYKTRIIEKLDQWGYQVNFYKIRNLEEFLSAVLYLPASITADFNFPEWGYYGRGSGQNMKWHEYPGSSQAGSAPSLGTG